MTGGGKQGETKNSHFNSIIACYIHFLRLRNQYAK